MNIALIKGVLTPWHNICWKGRLMVGRLITFLLGDGLLFSGYYSGYYVMVVLWSV